MANDLRKLKTTDSGKYWKTFKKSVKKTNCNIPMKELESFFKNLNAANLEGENDVDELPQESNENEFLDKQITLEEIEKAIKSLKYNKAAGIDEIENEYIKTTFEIYKNIYLNLFNLILQTGCFPEEWAIGLIIPIFKNKGNKNDPNNYRGITLISCLAKLFTTILNNRLKSYLENILLENQAGFREGYSTLDHIFTLHIIINLYKRMSKDLFMAFIDYQKAFDTIWRTGLWLKLIKSGVTGKFLAVIKDMYKKSKAYVFQNGQKSNPFNSEMGVKQGEILSPLLFAIYINDLQEYLKGKDIPFLSGIQSTVEEVKGLDDHLDFLLDIMTLYYADDTIILADSALGLQAALEELYEYCNLWKLVVNEGKTKILCITKQKGQDRTFYYNNKELEEVDEFCYLGITFCKKGLGTPAIKAREVSGKKAMFSVLNKCKTNELPIDISLELFEKMVIPTLLYGAEIWGFGNFIMLERIQLKFAKYLLKLKRNTPNKMIYGETGLLPLEYYVNSRIITFWVSLITGKQSKMSCKMYFMCLSLYRHA